MLSFLAVDIFYRVVALQMTPGKTAAAGPAAAAAAFAQKQPAESYRSIAERNLFMTTLKAIPDKSTPGAYLPSEEYTAFDLKGTIAVDPLQGYAIVEEKGKGKQKLYRVGEMIGSAKLVRVTRNTAVLQSGGRELIMKVKETPEGSLMGKSSPLPGGISLSRQDVTRSLGDLKSLMSQAVVRPNLVDGVQKGFVISNIMPGSLYQKLGLRNGDVVMDVNSKRLESADDILQMVNTMQTGGSVSVNLLRNGQSETLQYSFH
jgi:general secretion pathway protein C